MMRERTAVVLLIVTSWSSSALAGNWYAQMTTPKKVDACIEWEGTIDDSLAEMQHRFGNCGVNLDSTSLTEGFIIRCPARHVTAIVFRHERDCQSLKNSLAEKTKFNIDAIAPPGPNPGAWITGMSTCVETLISPEVVAKHALQKASNYCECMANGLGIVEDYNHDDQPPKQKLLVVTQRCLKFAYDRAVPLKKVESTFEAVGDWTSPRSQPIDVVSGATAANQVVLGEHESAISKGDSYSNVGRKLAAYAGEKTTSGDLLWVKYNTPALLAYPDSGGLCALTFNKGKLEECEGCNPEMFACEN
jgi:hypothetical protein